jgi:hypothetical protein
VPPVHASLLSTADGKDEKVDSKPDALLLPPILTLRDRCRFLLEFAEQKGLNTQQTDAFLLIGLPLLHHLAAAAASEHANSREGKRFTVARTSDEDADLVATARPLRLIIQGQAGSGKTRLIHVVQEFCRALGRPELLRTTAYMHLAAVAIGGVNLHKLVGMGAALTVKMPAKTRQTVQATWKATRAAIIDEYSMLGRRMFYCSVQRIGAALQNTDPASPLGPISTVLTGDLMQLPPVSDGALWADPDVSSNKKTADEQLAGRALFKQFDDVIFFDEIKRQEGDAKLQQLLRKQRYGDPGEPEAQLLKSRVLSVCKPGPAFLQQMTFIVQRNALRTLLNFKFCEELAKATGQPFLIAQAVDVPAGNRREPITEALQARLRRLPDEETKHLMGWDPVVVGEPVVIKENMWPRHGVCNGTLGTLVGLVLHADDRKAAAECPAGQRLVLRHLPIAALVQIEEMKGIPPPPRIPGWPERVVAIPPVEATFTVTVLQKKHAGMPRFVIIVLTLVAVSCR